MTDILEEIVAHKRIEIEQRKRFIQPRQMISLTEQKMQENDGSASRYLESSQSQATSRINWKASSYFS